MIVDVGAQLRRGVVEYCVLGQLENQQMYGWQLAETLTSRGMIASIGTLYPLLARLRAQGLVDAYQQRSSTGPTRKYYRLTEAGSQQLREFRLQWQPFTQAVSSFIERDES